MMIFFRMFYEHVVIDKVNPSNAKQYYQEQKGYNLSIYMPQTWDLYWDAVFLVSTEKCST